MGVELGRGLIGEQVAESWLLVTAAADPATGAEVSITVPGRARWQLIALQVLLTTDATVANRAVELAYDDQTSEFLRLPPPQNQAAGATRRYNYARGLGYTGTGGGANTYVLGLPEVPLLPGYRLRTVTSNLQAGDEFGAPVMLVRELPERGLLGEFAEELRELRHQLDAFTAAGGVEGF